MSKTFSVVLLSGCLACVTLAEDSGPVKSPCPELSDAQYEKMLSIVLDVMGEGRTKGAAYKAARKWAWSQVPPIKLNPDIDRCWTKAVTEVLEVAKEQKRQAASRKRDQLDEARQLLEYEKSRLLAARARILVLEEQLASCCEVTPVAANKEWSPEEKRSLVTVTVRSKKAADVYDMGRISHIEMDVAFHGMRLSRRAAAVKGLLRFLDVFGEEQYRAEISLTEPLSPGASVVSTFHIEYNKFTEKDMWLLGTELSKMKTIFEVTDVVYE